VLSASPRGMAGRPVLEASRMGRGPGGRQGRDETGWRRRNGASARWIAASHLADVSLWTPMRRSRSGRSPPRTSSSASVRLGRRGHGGDAGAGVPHAGDADWCSAPPPVGWRDAQHWKRRVWGVAPADATPHGRGGTRPAALPTRRCGRRCGDREVGGRRRRRLPPPRIDSAVVVTAAMPVLAYPTRGTLIGAQRLPPWDGRTPSTGSVAYGAWPRRTTRSGRDGVATPQRRISAVDRGQPPCRRVVVDADAAIEKWAVAAEDVFLRLGSTRPSWSRRRCRCWRTPRGGR